MHFFDIDSQFYILQLLVKCVIDLVRHKGKNSFP